MRSYKHKEEQNKHVRISVLISQMSGEIEGENPHRSKRNGHYCQHILGTGASGEN